MDEILDESPLKFIYQPKFERLKELVIECYEAAKERLKELAHNITYCPRTFDGFQCWTETPAGTTVTQKCPDHVVGFDPTRYGHKTCLENGTWWEHPVGKKAWTNYTNCINYEDMRFRSLVNNLYIGGYALSTFALSLALFIFWYFRSTLNCTRIRVHINLFSSVIITNLLWTIWYLTVINDVFVLFENPIWCQTLHVFTYYLMVTGYMWMFCEGLHLHLSLVCVFMKNEQCMLLFRCIGWGLPAIIMSAYSAVRIFSEKSTHHCWTDSSHAFLLISIPVLGSLVISLMFLANVVCVLYFKIRRTPRQSTFVALAKAAKAALVLIPLFGLHFILIPMHPSQQTAIEQPYQIFASVITSLQGVCLSIIFCFTNHDVINAIRLVLNRRRQRRDVFAMTAISGELLVI
ncbi:calcitonin gene-related peptide type 1 receptor-like [Zerene cesonia]|uniref:calcitonin gene-related peptide type 1 receptor-like n=1 Tax=Zerene cesonia TaxID=33412 RepID=UPI0018E55810|nr:calcitonin gene-related peptide type 1 receptor-like [Zerene cesonia]